jgi:hypothetical protein
MRFWIRSRILLFNFMRIRRWLTYLLSFLLLFACFFYVWICVSESGPADRVALRRVQRGVEPVGGRRLSGYSPLRLGGQDRPPPPGATHASGPSHKLQTMLRIRDPVPFWPLDPGSGMGKKSGSGIRDGKNSDRDPGWKKVGSRMRDKHHVSATLQNYPFE